MNKGFMALLLCCLLAVTASGQDPPPDDGDDPAAQPPKGASGPEKADEENSEPIDLFSGSFYYSNVDMTLPGRGLGFTFERTYRERTGPLPPDTPMGNRWDHSYNIYLEQDGSDLKLHDGYGRVDTYQYELFAQDGSWVSYGFFNRITATQGGGYLMETSDNQTYQFAGFTGSVLDGKVQLITDRNGNNVYIDYYTSGVESGQVAAVYNYVNFLVIFDYDQSSGNLYRISDIENRVVEFTYYVTSDVGGEANDLRSATTPVVGLPANYESDIYFTPTQYPDGKETIYTYTEGHSNSNLDHCLVSITDPMESVYLTNVYEIFLQDSVQHHRVETQIFGAHEYNYFYVHPLQSGDEINGAVRKTIVNDRAGNVEHLYYDAQNQLRARREYTGRAPDPGTQTTDMSNLPIVKLRSTDPEYYERWYDYNFDSLLVKKVNVTSGRTVEFDYDDIDVLGANIPNSDVQARGNLLKVRGTYDPVAYPGTVQATVEESWTYQPIFNEVVTYTDPNGYTTNYTYYGSGNLDTVIYPVVTNLGSVAAQAQIGWEKFDYNGHGQLTRHTWSGQGLDRVDAFEYDSDTFFLKKHTRNAGGISGSLPADAEWEEYETDARGNVIKVIDAFGNAEVRIYNELDQLVQKRHLAEPGEAIKAKAKTNYDYDANDNLVLQAVLNADHEGTTLGNVYFVTAYQYDALDRLTSVVQEVSESPFVYATTEYEYDANGNRSLTRYPEAVAGQQADNVANLEYGERDLVFRSKAGVGGIDETTTEYAYDGDENVVTIVEAIEYIGNPSNLPQPHVTELTHDGFSRVVELKDPMANVTTVEHDAVGNALKIWVHGERVDTTASGASGDVANNQLLSEVYQFFDERHRMYRSRAWHLDSEGVPISTGSDDYANAYTYYSPDNLVVGTENDNGHGSAFTYDGAHRLKGKLDSVGNTQVIDYDIAGRLETIIAADASTTPGAPGLTRVTELHYDSMSRLREKSVNGVTVEKSAYDSRGNLTWRADGRGNTTHSVIDGLGRLTTAICDLYVGGTSAGGYIAGITTTKAWDLSSRLVLETDDKGNTTEYEWDGLGRRVVERMADGSATTWSFDKHGNVLSSTDPLTNTVTSTYDHLNRIVARSISRAPQTEATTFEEYDYDGLSRVVRAEDDDSVVKRAYDSLSLLISEEVTINGGTPQTVEYVHDAVGNVTQVIYPGGRVIGYEHDALERIDSIREGSSALADYGYVGSQGHVNSTTFVNGVVQSITYDPRKRPTGTSHVYDPAGANVPIDIRVSGWDVDGNRISRDLAKLGGGSVRQDYEYDSADRMVRSTRGGIGTTLILEYNLDGVGNRIDVVGGSNGSPYTMNSTIPWPADVQVNQYTHGPADPQLLSESRYTRWDAEGNLIRQVKWGPLYQVDYTYDYRNQMTSADGDMAYDRVEYRYDALGRLVSRRVLDVGYDDTVLYFYYRWQCIEEQDDFHATQATYVYGPGVDRLVEMTRNQTAYYFHADDMGNVVRLSNSGGGFVEGYEYADYGQPLEGTSLTALGTSSIGNPYYFTGKRWDPIVEVYYYRTRWYQPSKGRFTTRDVIGIWGDPGNLGNGSTYCGNNPWSYRDDFGMQICKAEESDKLTVKKIRDGLQKERRKLADQERDAQNELDDIDKEAEPAKWEQANEKLVNISSKLAAYDALIGAGNTIFRHDLSDPNANINIVEGTVGYDPELAKTLGQIASVLESIVGESEGEQILTVLGARLIGSVIKSFRGVKAAKAAKATRGTTRSVDLNKLKHIFRPEHNLDGLVRASGGSAENAYNAVQKAANQALSTGRLSPLANGVLPGGGAGVILNVNGVTVQMIGGRVIDGAVKLGTFVGL